MSQLKIGIYGRNGHQIHHIARKTPNLELVAVAGCKAKDINLEEPFPVEYESLKDLLADENVEMVSLCSPYAASRHRKPYNASKRGNMSTPKNPAP